MTATTGEHRLVSRDPAVDRVCAKIIEVVEALRGMGGRPSIDQGQQRR